MSGLLAIFLLKGGGEILVLCCDLSPFLVPTFEIEEFHASRYAAHIGIRMVRRYLHAYFQLTAAAEPFGRIEKFFGLFSVEDVAAGLLSHDDYPPDPDCFCPSGRKISTADIGRSGFCRGCDSTVLTT